MPKEAPRADLALAPREPGATITRWLYDELRTAILDGRLRRGARLPPTRDLAEQHSVSRRIAVNVFEQLRAEGYLESRAGSGTTVSRQIPDDFLTGRKRRSTPSSARPSVMLHYRRPARPFRPIEPALAEFPAELWTRTAARAMRHMSAGALAGGDVAGSPALRQAIAEYLGASRGVVCTPDEIVIVSGTQQALDFLARLLIEKDSPVWMEDPVYTGALDAFRGAGAQIVPVRVDEDGLDPAIGKRRSPRPRAIYLTPAHQFGTGATLSLERRFDILRLARQCGALILEDDYDSEFRFSGKPIPAMKGLDPAAPVFLLGTFNKSLFPALRLGYIVAPQEWIDQLRALRNRVDRYPSAMPQAALERFMLDGHFARHLRRMRELYGARLNALQSDAKRYLSGAVRLPGIQAGLNIPAYLENGAALSADHNLELFPLKQFALERRDLNGFILGFAAFNEREIRQGVLDLAKALDGPKLR